VKVLPGADIFLKDSLALIKGKRVGVVCNHTSVLRNGTHFIRAAMDRGMTLEAIFTPEHGFDGAIEAGEEVSSGSYKGIQVWSLYGATKKPTKEMLSGIDVLIIDLQSVGVRFYTYESTLFLCMEAAAENSISIIVLDRPNPLTGEMVEGPVLDITERSFVGMMPIPIRHGLTMGELARMIKGEQWINSASDLDLHVIPMDGWRRRLWYDDTDLTWLNPSPNLRDMNTAVLYPGLCLLEGTNLSEGRGTETPFQQFGSPSFPNDSIANVLNAQNLPGVKFETTEFIPELRTSAHHPKYEGQRCKGVYVQVTDRRTFQPVRTGLYILSTFLRVSIEKHQTLSFLNSLVGKPSSSTQLKSLHLLTLFLAQTDIEVRNFLRVRNPYLLYHD